MHKRAFSVVSLEKSVSNKDCKVLSVELDSRRLRICFLAAEWATIAPWAMCDEYAHLYNRCGSFTNHMSVVKNSVSSSVCVAMDGVAESEHHAPSLDISPAPTHQQVPCFGVRIIRILLFGVLYWGPLFSETPI